MIRYCIRAATFPNQTAQRAWNSLMLAIYVCAAPRGRVFGTFLFENGK